MRHPNRRTPFLLTWIFTVALAAAAAAQPTSILDLATVATNLDDPVALAHAGDPRLFIVTRPGRIFILENNAVRPQPFLDLRDRVLFEDEGEGGLLSLAFHPDYSANGFFFLTYSNHDGDSVIARYQVTDNPNVADPDSERILLVVEQFSNNHHVDHLAFGPDGYLYVAAGDGGYLQEPRCSGQMGDNLRGKMLRLDVDQNVGSPPYYGIPAGNPFAGPGGPRDEIWALGLRNPWRFSFDRETGDLFLADVGHSQREEVNHEPAGSPGGRNYGFKVMEGTVCRGNTSGCPANVPPCFSAAYTPPIFDYGHGSGRCAVIGGHVYRGSAVPELFGDYVFGDFCGTLFRARSSSIGWLVDPAEPRLFGIQTFGEDAAGELYLTTGDTLYRIAGLTTLERGSVALASAAFSGAEGSTVTIGVRRLDGSDGAISVGYATVAGSAVAGSDFVATSGTLSWADGDAADKSFTVTLLDDALVEGAEMLTVELRDPTGGTTLVVPFTAPLTIVDPDLPAGPCVAGDHVLCLTGGRFRVELAWQAPQGNAGPGNAVPLTDDTGYFWFFNPENVEIVVKVLDACFDPYQHFWVFAGGLTNVQTRITVLDTMTGLLRQYDNPQGNAFLPIQDTNAFATCP